MATLWPPFTQEKLAPPPLHIVRGKGAYLYTQEGTAILDAISSWWVNLHGHAHPYIAERISAQANCLEHVLLAGCTHPPALELADRLIHLLPKPLAKIFYSDNGSTVIEAALKMAFQYWYNKKQPKKTVISFKGGYHGDTFGAMSAAGKNFFNKPFWSHLFDVQWIDPPIQGNDSLSQLNHLLQQNDVACFIFEPLILGAGGMIPYSAEGLNRLIKRCHDNNVLTIADEVMTGFGRTGTLFACEQLDVTPSILCLSKGITGGFLPLGVTACQEEIYQAFYSDQKEHAFLHGHSYTGNPLACASALANLDLLEHPSCIVQRKEIEESHAVFCRAFSPHPFIKRCESLGTILIVEYVTDEVSYFHPIRDTLYQLFLDAGILVRPLGPVLYILPPYCITQKELQHIYNTILRSLC